MRQVNKHFFEQKIYYFNYFHLQHTIVARVAIITVMAVVVVTVAPDGITIMEMILATVSIIMAVAVTRTVIVRLLPAKITVNTSELK